MNQPIKRNTHKQKAPPAFKFEGYHLVAVLGMISFGLILFFSSSLLVSKLQITQFIVLCCLGGLLLPLQLYDRFFGWGKIAAFMINLFGVGPCIAALLLMANYTFSSDTTVVQHTAVSVEVVQDYEPYFLFELENNALQEFEEFRRFNVYEETKHYADASAIQYSISTGCFGYGVVKETTVLP